MKRVFLFFSAIAAFILSGCITTDYHGEDFPPTLNIELLPRNSNIPENCRIIGSGTASGEYSSAGVSRRRARLVENPTEEMTTEWSGFDARIFL